MQLLQILTDLQSTLETLLALQRESLDISKLAINRLQILAHCDQKEMGNHQTMASNSPLTFEISYHRGLVVDREQGINDLSCTINTIQQMRMQKLCEGDINGNQFTINVASEIEERIGSETIPYKTFMKFCFSFIILSAFVYIFYYLAVS